MEQAEGLELPMDLADASLFWVAHAYGLRNIATLDRRDFGVYRLLSTSVLSSRSSATKR